MRDSERYPLVSVRRRNGGMFHRGTLQGKEILTKTLQWVIPGTFVIARMQIVHGACTFAPEDFAGCAVSKSYSSFASTPRCDAKFFSWLARHPLMYAYFVDSSHGVVIEKMTFDQDRWLSQPICLPPPAEQSRIVEILDSVEECIRSTELLITKLEKLNTALVCELLTGGSDTDLERARVGEVLHRAEYGISSPLDYCSGTPVLRMNNLKDGEVDTSDLKSTLLPVPRKLMLSTGDVLFNRTNSFDNVGRTSIWRGPSGAITFASYLVRLVQDDRVILPEYLTLWLNLEEVQKEMRRFATPGVHQVNINPTNLKKVGIRYPTSLAQQAAVCKRVAASREPIIRMRSELGKLLKLKQGLMEDLLMGRVRPHAEAV
ncbi:restriction endonuclease subunit S [Micromonospora sp. M61]|uniref:restriction endonuclease subunit S n=1 Tax=Micromonospora sp. M61 TaxID=2824890 RepID=UPI001B36FEED|nr:restriction endonuclease subunit S [Micromonospora sp. M61]MBQ0977861.1 restriction endonuclease subunit S [Micromonospora sp. M61]